MGAAIGSSIDKKNIGLAMLLFSLRHDLDIHCLIGVNATEISHIWPGKFFLGQVAKCVLESIILGICKVFEDEKRFELNSIQGVLNSLSQNNPNPNIDKTNVREFLNVYGVPCGENDSLKALQSSYDQFKKKYSVDLDRFKTARDKGIAHSEYQAMINSVPSFDTMEKLFFFGADFYNVISDSFVGCGPEDLKNRREVKRDFQQVLNALGVKNIKTEME